MTQGIRKRDQIVFEFAKKQKKKPIPIMMVTSGGYQRNNARIIADSILNLRQKGLIGCQAAEEYQGTKEEDLSLGQTETGRRGRGRGLNCINCSSDGN